jgi:tape measure domain-containing protein
MADRDLELRLIIRADGSLAVRNMRQVETELDNVGEHARNAGGELRDMGNQVNAAGGIMGRFSGLARSFGAGLIPAIPAVVGAAIGLFVKNLINVNQEMDDVRDHLNDVTGSAEKTEQKFAQLQQLAEDSKFTVGELADTYADLHNHGLVPTGEVMLAITNSASKLEDSSKKLADITGILGKAWAEGHLSGDALFKLIDLGIPALDLMQRHTGKSAEQLVEMAKQGKLGREAISGLITEMGKFASGENERGLETIRGRFDQLSETWDRFIDNLAGEKTEGAIKTVSGWIQSMIQTFTNAVNYLDLKINGPTNLSQINQEIERLQGNLARLRTAPGQSSISRSGQLIEIQDELKALKQKRDAILQTEQAEKKAFAESKKQKVNPDGKKTRRDSSLDDAKQQAAAEVQIQLDKIARIEQIANAEFQNDIARAEAQATEKLAKAKGNQAAELAIEQELADAKAQIARNQLEAERSFNEERLQAQLAGKQQELALTKDRGEQAKIQADIVKLEEQIKTARELSGLAAQKLATDETAAAAQRAQAQQNLVDQVILKYDLLAARMKEFDADAAIISASNLPEERKAEILAQIAQRYGEAGKAAEQFGRDADQFAEQAGRNVQNTLANSLFGPWDQGLRGMLRTWIDTLRRIISEALAADIAHTLGIGGKENTGGNAQALLDGFTGLFGSADDVAQVTANEAAKTAAVTAGEAARTAAVTSGAAAKTAAITGSQAAQTSAVVAGETARQAAETAGQGKSLITVITTAGKKIHAFAASAAAGAYDAMASIPYVGPILGGIAAAVTYAAVLAFGALTGGSAFATGGRVDGTAGGRISGPGTPTSDSVPAWLSDKEAVLKAESVRKLDQKYGSGLVDYLNQYGDLPQSMKALAGNLQIPKLDMPTVKFSTGGRVNASSVNQNNVRVDPANVDARTRIDIVNVVDPSLVHDALANAGGRRALLNVVSSNPSAFRQALEL